MNRNGLFMVIFGMVMILVMTACSNPNNDDDEKDEWPDASGYTLLTVSTATNGKTSVSPGEKFYSRGSFNSPNGSSYYCAITSEENCKIIIDFRKFTFGSLYRKINNGPRYNWSSGTPITITAGDILLFEAFPNKQFSITAGYHWMFGFSVAAE
jgi:hypothetical protein